MSKLYEEITKKPIPERMRLLTLIFMGLEDEDEAEVIIKLNQ